MIIAKSVPITLADDYYVARAAVKAVEAVQALINGENPVAQVILSAKYATQAGDEELVRESAELFTRMLEDPRHNQE